jgi:predicted  nucleic acid-binding Zn-ribbon protein
MQRTCPKCGHVNEQASEAPDATCPQCGVIYAKAAAHMVRQRQVDSVRSRVDATVRKETAVRSTPTTMERIAWIGTFLFAVLGLVQLVYTVIHAESAPQQAAGAAIAVAWAAIPYCMARAIQLFNR